MPYVSIRVEAINQSQATGQAAHDTRCRAPRYLRRPPQAKCGLLRVDGRTEIFRETAGKENIHADLASRLLSMRQEKKAWQPRTLPFIRGVLTFSPEPFSTGEVHLGDWSKRCQRAIREAAKYLGVELIYVAVHLDEATPHYHFLFENWNHETHRTVMRGTTPSSLRELQTVVSRAFDGMFERGRSREITNATHLSVLESHRVEASKACAEAAKSREEIDGLLEQIRSIKAELESRKVLRKAFLERVQHEEQDQKRRREKYRNYDAATRKRKAELALLEKHHQALKAALTPVVEDVRRKGAIRRVVHALAAASTHPLAREVEAATAESWLDDIDTPSWENWDRKVREQMDLAERLNLDVFAF